MNKNIGWFEERVNNMIYFFCLDPLLHAHISFTQVRYMRI